MCSTYIYFKVCACVSSYRILIPTLFSVTQFDKLQNEVFSKSPSYKLQLKKNKEKKKTFCEVIQM